MFTIVLKQAESGAFVQDSKHTKEWVDADGTLWRYVEYDEKGIQIERCITQADYLEIPSQIGDKSVFALAIEACAYLPTVQEIRCPDSITSVGLSAFRGNDILRKIRFSQNLSTFDSGWVRNCPKLNHVELPGQVAVLESNIFDIPNLETLVIGRETAGIQQGMFAKSKLMSLEVDDANPYFATDGKALYSFDWSELLALAVPTTKYSVIKTCKKISAKGFSNFSALEIVEFNEGLEELDDFALARTGITSFTAPSSLRYVGRKAFYECRKLSKITLNEGLVSILEHAFSDTAIHELIIPASIEILEYPLATGTDLLYRGEEASFRLAEGSSKLSLDDGGALYRKDKQGKQLVRLMDPHATHYEVQEGTVYIAESAFAGLVYLKKISIPRGVKVLGQAACKGCTSLEEVVLPLDIERIESEACMDTALRNLLIPASLTYIGERALITEGAHHGTEEPSLRNVRVAKGNKQFYMKSGLLLERKSNGKSRVVLCTGSVDVVRVPFEVDEISDYAFNNVKGIRELHISDRISNVRIRGLAVGSSLDRIRIETSEAIEGRHSFDLSFPRTDRGEQQERYALSKQGSVDVRVYHEHYDSAIVNASSFNAGTGRSLNVYDQAKLIITRMLDPVFMTPGNRSMFDHILRSNLIEVSVEIARRDDRRTFDVLFDLGYIDESNLCDIIDAVSVLQDAVITSHLLEAKRSRFKQVAIDFDI